MHLEGNLYHGCNNGSHFSITEKNIKLTKNDIFKFVGYSALHIPYNVSYNRINL